MDFARRFFLPAALAVQFLAACGGGGNGSEPSPPIDRVGLAQITKQNAPTVAGVVAEVALEEGVFGALLNQGLPFGAIGSNGAVTVAAKLASPATLLSATSGLAPCAVSGTVDVVVTAANPQVPSIGDRYEFIFEACDNGTGTVTGGSLAITITALGGDFASGSFLIGMGLELTAFQVTEDGETSMASGSVSVEIDTTVPSVTTITVSTSALAANKDGAAEAISDLTISISQNESVFPVSVTVDTSFRISSPRIGGDVIVTTALALQSTGEEYPFVGELRITANDNTALVLIALDSNTVRLELDLDGDGATDDVIETTWDEILAAAAAAA